MAKTKNKKTDDILAEDVWTPPDFSKRSRSAGLIDKVFGEGVCVNGKIVLEKNREIIPVSPALDAQLHGGIQTGTLVTLAGDAGCGKTSTALQIAATWQQMDRRVFYFAAESRITRKNLESIHGFDANKMEVIQSKKGQIMTAEKFLTAAEMVIKNEEKALVIIDSFSILSDSTEMSQSDYDDSPVVGGSQRLVGRWCRKMAPIIPINDNLVIGIAHWYTNIGGKKKWAVSLPKKIEYARLTGLTCEYIEHQYAKDKDGKAIGQAWGQLAHWKVERTPLGPPGGKAHSLLRYDYGLDKEFEIIEAAKNLSLIDKSGAWYTLDWLGEDPPKFQGQENTRQFLFENPLVYEDLSRRVRYLSFAEELPVESL